MENDAAMLTNKLLSGVSWKDFMVNMLMIAIIPAVGEEFLFRGIVQKIFYEWTRRPHLAIFISAILFSTVHMQFFGFIPRMLLGVLFGYFFYWSGNIWLSVLAHFLNNAIAIILHFLEITNRSYIPNFLTDNSTYSAKQIFLSVLIVTVGIFLIKKYCPIKFTKQEL